MADNSFDTVPSPRAASINVLFLNTPTRPPLGADTWVHGQILRRLDRTQHHLHAACVVGSPGKPTPTYQLFGDIDGVHIHPVDLGIEISRDTVGTALRGALAAVLPALLSGVRLLRLVRRHHIAIVYTSDRPRDAVAAVLLAALGGAKSVIHVHTAWGTWMSRPLRWALRRADALIAVSQFVAGTLADSGHDRRRIHVVLNAIDPAAWVPGFGRDDARRELGVSPEAPMVLSVCRLFPEKGPAELIRACAAMRGDVPCVRLVIVGVDTTGGGFSAKLRDLVNELDMADAVVFAGRREDVPRLMAAADVFAMPSFGEPFGLVFAEAMAMEVPVVGLDHGGTREVVENGRTGLLAEPGDVEGLAAMIVKLLQDRQLREDFGRAGRARVLARLTVDRMADDVAEVYRRVLDQPRDQKEDPL